MEGGFAYLGILELIEGDPAPPIVTRKVRVDFGRHDGTNGNATASPDTFGNYWNNFGVTANGTTVPNLVTTTNAATTMGITLTSANWQNNGILNGGLTAANGQSPLESRLGDLAVETATQDYFFNSGATGLTTSLKVTGLSPTKHYSMRLFGSRKANNATDIRRSTYTVVAGNGTFAGTLQTTGPGIGNGLGGDDGNTTYDGNNRTTVALGGMQPTTAGELTLQMSIAEGGFSHLNILEIVESVSVPPLALSGEVDRWTSQDALDPVTPGGVLFVGSSSIRRWENLTKDFADYRIVQRGFGGSQFSDLNPIVNRIVTPYQPSAIVVFEGTNDIRVGGKTGEQVKADFETFVTLVRAQLPTVPICYIGITPVPSFFNNPDHDPYRRTANSLIKTYCESTAGLHFFDTNTLLDDLHDNNFAEWETYFVDDTHLNRKGYDHFTSVIRPKLQAILAPNKTFTANPDTLVAGEKLFFDFGPSDIINGDQTIAADANGNRWNNWHATNGGGGIHAGEHLPNLIRSTGTNSGIRMTMTAGFLCNGKTPFGGLYAPQAGLLGELATETATNDFFYSTANDVNDGLSDDAGGGFMLEGLDPALSYEFRFLGARDNTQARTTKYDIHGSNSGTTNLVTSGTGISSTGTANINDDEVAVISGIRPDAFGQVWVDLTVVQGDFAYINAMQITASTPVTAPPLQSWRSSHFTAGELGNAALEATLWGNDADPDSDGRVNLLEYACGTDPQGSDADPTAFALVSDGGEFITLTYQRNLDATDVTFLVQKADNLTDWSGVADTTVSTSGNIETRKATVSRAGFDRLWLRLKVELAAAM
jgi:lysophospholipase L1-like esterase